MFFNLSVLSKSPAEMSPPIGVILELRSHANLPFRKLALKILIEFVLNLNWWFHEETAIGQTGYFPMEKKKLFRFWKKNSHTKNPYQSVMFDVMSEWLTQLVTTRPRAQFPSSVNKTSQWQLACSALHRGPRPPSMGIKGERVQTHISFSLRSRAFQRKSPRVSTDCYSSWCYGTSVGVAVQCCCFSSDSELQLFILRSHCDLPWALQHFFLKSNSKRAI